MAPKPALGGYAVIFSPPIYSAAFLPPKFITELFNLLVRHSIFLDCPDAGSRASPQSPEPTPVPALPTGAGRCRQESTEVQAGTSDAESVALSSVIARLLKKAAAISIL